MTQPQPLVGLELPDLQQLLGPQHPSYRAKQLYQALYKQKLSHLSSASNLPAALRHELSEQYTLGLPEVQQYYDSSDGTRRYLLQLHDKRTIETVLMPEESRDTVCISTQVGCPVDCKFCLTALLGIERNLTAGEIVGQILLVAAAHGLSPDDSRLNVVMMGMGEPLLNLENVLKASRILLDAEGVGMSPRRITVSTSGIIPKIAEFGAAPNAVRPKLAISLNASTEEQRQRLMPITRKWHLKDLMEACRVYPLRPWEKLTFEYVLLRGVNDSDADARRVLKLLSNINCKVNLIALNPGPGIPFETPYPARIVSFQNIIRSSLPCFIRKPRGLDIYAACGQLKRTTELVSLS